MRSLLFAILSLSLTTTACSKKESPPAGGGSGSGGGLLAMSSSSRPLVCRTKVTRKRRVEGFQETEGFPGLT